MRWLERMANAAARRELAELRRELEELEHQLEVEQRRLLVAQAEIDALCLVVGRDRARVQAESAEFQRRRAEAEGVHQNGQLDKSSARF